MTTEWITPLPPAELAERRIIEAILDGSFPIESNLPAERELAARLGITRPTLREVLQRLSRDGWLEIRHGKPTRIRDYWCEGSIAILGTIARYPEAVPGDFVSNLLQVRILLAPAYTCGAIQHAPSQVIELLEGLLALEDTPAAYAAGDWRLHHELTILSGNPVFTLILNGFAELYRNMGLRYFLTPQSRARSHHFYTHLLNAVRANDCSAAETVVKEMMQESLAIWLTV